jgi:hypothetical protein
MSLAVGYRRQDFIDLLFGRRGGRQYVAVLVRRLEDGRCRAIVGPGDKSLGFPSVIPLSVRREGLLEITGISVCRHSSFSFGWWPAVDAACIKLFGERTLCFGFGDHS